MSVSPQTESSIIAEVDDQPRGHKEIHARVGMWSDRTIKGVLDNLARRGIVEKTVIPGGRFGMAQYSLKAKGK